MQERLSHRSKQQPVFPFQLLVEKDLSMFGISLKDLFFFSEHNLFNCRGTFRCGKCQRQTEAIGSRFVSPNKSHRFVRWASPVVMFETGCFPGSFPNTLVEAWFDSTGGAGTEARLYLKCGQG